MAEESNLFFRKHTLGELISLSYKLFIKNFLQFIITSSILYFLTFFLFGNLLMEKLKEFMLSCSFNFSSDPGEQAFGLVANNILPLLKIFSFFLFFILINYIIKVFLISYNIRIIDNYSKNIHESIFNTFTFTLKNHLFYGVTAGIIILFSMIFGTMVGVIALIFGSIIIIILLTVSLVFVFPIIVIEHCTPIEAYTGSIKMVNRFFWQTMFYAGIMVLCLGLPIAIFQVAFIYPFYLSIIDIESIKVFINTDTPTTQESLNFAMDLFKNLENNHLTNSILFSIVYSLSIPISSIIPTLLYYHIRAQKEVVL